MYPKLVRMCIMSPREWLTLDTPCLDDICPFPIHLAAHHLISNSLVVLVPSTNAINISCRDRDFHAGTRLPLFLSLSAFVHATSDFLAYSSLPLHETRPTQYTYLI